MAGKTTNLQLQKIDDTDYAGNFPTIYNNNLDLIDGLKSDLITSVAGKQDKLIAGDGISIASDGKTISAKGKVEPQKIPIANSSELKTVINNMKVGDRIVGDAICFKNSQETGGISVFNLEKLNYSVNLGSFEKAIVVKNHGTRMIQSKGPGSYYISNVYTFPSVIVVSIISNGIRAMTGFGLNITEGNNIVFDLSNANNNSGHLICYSNTPNNHIFKNVYWLKY